MACLREKQRKTQEQVASTAGVTASMISNYERGKEKPSLDSLWKILGALNCTLIDLEAALRFVRGDKFPVRSTNWQISVDTGEYETGGAEPQDIADADFDLEKLAKSDRPLPRETERALAAVTRAAIQLVFAIGRKPS